MLCHGFFFFFLFFLFPFVPVAPPQPLGQKTAGGVTSKNSQDNARSPGRIRRFIALRTESFATDEGTWAPRPPAGPWKILPTGGNAIVTRGRKRQRFALCRGGTGVRNILSAARIQLGRWVRAR